MRVLIVEDEIPIAEDIKALVKKILESELELVRIENTLEGALAYMSERSIDVLLLDLNLNSKNGFEILKQVVSKSFHTIIVSANTQFAIQAFEYGVLDFVPKPFDYRRLKKAFDRLKANHALSGEAIKYISVRTGSGIEAIPLEDVKYFKACNIYTELNLNNGKKEICDKSLKKLMPLLPPHYLRIHKSYLVALSQIRKILVQSGGRYRAVLRTGEFLPISRNMIKQVKKMLNA